MKFFSALIFTLVTALIFVFPVTAQSAETIWIQANPTTYKTGETVTATINAITSSSVQGFTAQIRYDPACLEPVNATSPISGMNGLAVPQTSGVVDASFASTTPQIANGVLAEVRFTALKGCQTNLAIETAALVVRNEAGFAAPLTGININTQAVVLNIDSAAGVPQPAVSGESVLPLVPTIFPEPEPANGWIIALLVLLALIAITTVVVVFRLSRK